MARMIGFIVAYVSVVFSGIILGIILGGSMVCEGSYWATKDGGRVAVSGDNQHFRLMAESGARLSDTCYTFGLQIEGSAALPGLITFSYILVLVVFGVFTVRMIQKSLRKGGAVN